MFDVGQKVVCVNGKFPRAVLNYLRDLPREGKVYRAGAETCALLLREVRNPPPPHRKQWGECGFDPRRFHPLDDIEQEQHEYESIGTFNP